VTTAKPTPAQNALLKRARLFPGRIPAHTVHKTTLAGLVNRGLVVVAHGVIVPIVPSQETR
jgi:hypothetical protein